MPEDLDAPVLRYWRVQGGFKELKGGNRSSRAPRWWLAADLSGPAGSVKIVSDCNLPHRLCARQALRRFPPHRNAPPNADSQCGRILRLLESRRGEWVALPEILALRISQYGTRVKELRDDWGLLIENKVEMVDGQRRSWFRLVDSLPKQKVVSSPESVPESEYMRRINEEQARAMPLFAGVCR